MTEVINRRVSGIRHSSYTEKWRYINLDGSPFTDDDLNFFYKKRDKISIFDNKYSRFDWVVRNKNGSVSFFRAKPQKSKSKWLAVNREENGFGYVITTNKFKNYFPNIKWEDEEPINIWEHVDIESLPINFGRKQRTMKERYITVTDKSREDFKIVYKVWDYTPLGEKAFYSVLVGNSHIDLPIKSCRLLNNLEINQLLKMGADVWNKEVSNYKKKVEDFMSGEM